MPIYARMEHYEGVNLYSSYIMGGGAAIAAIAVIISLILKLKNNY
jgi:hypothetical protein